MAPVHPRVKANHDSRRDARRTLRPSSTKERPDAAGGCRSSRWSARHCSPGTPTWIVALMIAAVDILAMLVLATVT
jgi:hypothetical protein